MAIQSSKIFVLCLCLVAIACKKQTFDLNEIARFADDSFKSKDYGELPLLPENLNIKSGTFISFLSQSGEFKQAVAKEDSTVFVMKDGKKTECRIAKGDKVYVVASVETEDGKRLAIVQPAKPCVFQNPRTNELLPISEGYADLGDLQFIADTSNEPEIPNKTIAGVNNQPPVLAGAGPGCLRMTQTFHASECGVGGTPCAIPGYLLRAGAPGFNIKIMGNAPRWVVNVEKLEGGGSKPTPRRLFDSNNLTKSPDGGVLFPMASLLGTTTDWSFATVRFSGQAATADGIPFGPVCSHQFYSASPLVLDLSQSQQPLRTIPLGSSEIQFDLDKSGVKKSTGWIYPYAGFLAMDQNKNGVIDDGSELFGQYTQVTEKLNRFGNGFLALKMYDDNHDGYIDANDAKFRDFIVWQDENLDGVSQFSEMRSLNILGITKISVQFHTVALNKDVFANQAPFVGKFWGPNHCGDKGCHMYDVFFKTSAPIDISGVNYDR